MKTSSKGPFFEICLAFSLFIFTGTGCRDASSTPTIASHFEFIEPSYNNIQLRVQQDSLHFPLNEHTFNAIRSLNYFQHQNATFLSFYDRGSKSINIYDFNSKRLVKRIPLIKWLKSSKLDKASVYIKNFDSIIVTTLNSLYLLDSTGTVRNEMKFYEDNDKKATITTTTPPVLKNGIFYLGTKPVLDDKSLSAHQQWRVLYGFDMEKGTRDLYYSLPEIYQKNLYPYPYLEYSYCVNDRGNLVFSFPADSNIYETNLTDYHMAYYAKSQFQKAPIQPLPKDYKNSDDAFKQYSLNFTYGPIIYDPFRKRYLRQAKQPISEADFIAKKGLRKKSILIFDEHFKIIGEHEFKDEFSLGSLFFTADGRIYARTKGNDEYGLHFVRLAYAEDQGDSTRLQQHQAQK